MYFKKEEESYEKFKEAIQIKVFQGLSELWYYRQCNSLKKIKEYIEKINNKSDNRIKVKLNSYDQECYYLSWQLTKPITQEEFYSYYQKKYLEREIDEIINSMIRCLYQKGLGMDNPYCWTIKNVDYEEIIRELNNLGYRVEQEDDNCVLKIYWKENLQ